MLGLHQEGIQLFVRVNDIQSQCKNVNIHEFTPGDEMDSNWVALLPQGHHFNSSGKFAD